MIGNKLNFNQNTIWSNIRQYKVDHQDSCLETKILKQNLRGKYLFPTFIGEKRQQDFPVNLFHTCRMFASCPEQTGYCFI